MPSTKPFIMRYNEVVKMWLDLNSLALNTETSSLSVQQAKSLATFVNWYYLG
jgi:hypothetical protein